MCGAATVGEEPGIPNLPRCVRPPSSTPQRILASLPLSSMAPSAIAVWTSVSLAAPILIRSAACVHGGGAHAAFASPGV